MRSLFRSKHKITQAFGVNPEYYKQFGLKGHEGLDLIPTGSVWDVLCLEDGVVVRDIDDATLGKNYGKNVTVWHPSVRRASQYCHLNSNAVQMGERLTKGQVLGVMGKTGNTTGAHVHLNLFDVDENGVRLNKDNGYFGGIDPLPFIEEPDPVGSQDTVPVPKSQFAKLERVEKIYNKIRAKLDVEDNETVVLQAVDTLEGYKDAVIQKDRQLQEAIARTTELEGKLNELQGKYDKVASESIMLSQRAAKQEITIQGFNTSMQTLAREIEELKKQATMPVFRGWKKAIVDLISKL